MAAIIQLRRGSSPSSLSYGEPYINDDSASLVVGLSGSNDIITLTKLEQKNFGNLWIDGDLTASNISASGDIRIGGQLFLGDAAEDAVVIQGSLSSSLIPESGSTYNLGSSAKPWNSLHIGQILATTTVVTSSAQITAFGFVSSSTNISSINNFTQSADQRLDSLENDSGSYLTSSGSVSYDDITSKPTLLSGSAQITAFGFNSSSTNISSLNTFSSSADQRLDSLEGDSGSYLTSIDGGIVSSSAQITAFGFTSSSTDIVSLNSFTQSFNTAITLNSDDVTILGNLTVQGTETTLNTQTLQVEDKNILVASGAADSAAANGAGLTIDGANKSLQWNHTDSQFRFDADVSASSFYGDGSNLTNVGAPLTSLNSFTASNGNDSLNAATSSYLTSSGSVDYSDLTSIPSSIVSSSAQITAFGFVSSSGGNLTSLNAFTQSADQRLDSLELDSGSYLTSSGSVDFTDITSVPSEIVSSSAQITAFGFVSESTSLTSLNSYTSSNDINISNIHSTTSSLEQRVGEIESNTGSYDDLTNISSLNTFTSSADQRLGSLENASGSYLTSSGSVDYSDITSLPTLVSQSDQVNYNNLLNKPAFIGGTNVTITSASNGVTINSTGGGGGSADLSHLNAFTQSATTRFTQLSNDTGSQNQRLDSLESESGSYLTSVPNAHINTSLNSFTASNGNDSLNAATSSYLTSLDSGIVSSSEQITAFGFVSESSNLTSLNSYTASNDINITNIHSTTSSLEQRVGQIEVNTGSYGGGGTDLTQLNTFTSSADQRLDSLEAESGSYFELNGTNQTINGNNTFSALNTFEGDIMLDTNIVHNGDNDTRFTFGTNSITLRAGTNSFLNISATEIVANSQGNDIDFRVRGNTDNHTLYVDGGNDRVHIGESTGGTQKLNIKGAVSASSYYGDGSNLEMGYDLTSLNSFTASNGNNSLNSTTSSFDQRLDSLEGESGSYNTITSFNTFTSSLGTVSTFAVTQSVQNDDTLIPTARAVSASIAEIDTADLTSLNSFTSSNGNDSLNTFTGSNGNTSINSFTSSFNTAISLNSDDVTVLGNLTVQGTETILNTQTLNIEDKNLLIASGAADSSAANGGGITIDGANATITWSDSNTRLEFNKSLHITGDVEATGDIVAFASSDERLKDNIQPIKNPLEKLSQISGKTFDWNEEKQNIYKGRDYGVIAQEIESVLPELVNTREDTGYKAVKYDKLVPLLIESIKELQKQIEELKSK